MAVGPGRTAADVVVHTLVNPDGICRKTPFLTVCRPFLSLSRRPVPLTRGYRRCIQIRTRKPHSVNPLKSQYASMSERLVL